VASEKNGVFLRLITSSNIDTSSVSLHYLVKCQCLKATTKTKSTSITSHFISASFSRKADTLNTWRKTAGCDSYFRQ